MKKFFIISLLLSLCFHTFSQSLNLDGIRKAYLRSSGPIIEGKEIRGYYILYFEDKADKQNNIFKLVVLDENLNKIAEKEIIDNKDIFISDMSFNGNYLAVKFLNFNKKSEEQIVRIYDNSLKEISKKTFPIERKAYSMTGLNMSGNDDEVESVDLQGVQDVGFLNFTPCITKSGYVPKTGLTMQLFPTESGYNTWTYNTPDKMIEYPFFLSASNKIVLISSIEKEKVMSKDLMFKVAGFDLHNGKELFRKELQDDTYDLEVVNAVYLPEVDKNIIFGNIMSNEKKKDTKEESLGMFFSEINDKGELIGKKNLLWSEFAKTFKPVDEKGNAVDFGKVYIHKVIRTNDGNIFAIGERFRKAASAMGIMSAVMGGTKTSVVKFVIEDLVIIKLDKNYNPVEVKFIDKGKTNVDNLPAGAGTFGTAVSGMYLKTIGGFDYEYTQETQDGSSFTVGYRKIKGRKENYFGAVSYKDGKFTEDKVDLKESKEDATFYRVLPAKPGYIMVYEYYKKTKTIEVRLEKVNL